MPEVSLRAYGRQIDELIEREKLEEAIAHCRYVLQIYPKHLETYRLLGKAYLEYKRFGDAADIFQRVLSAVPDDFVSHIGMAIVREDEGNLDAAIWHMERAFETNPSNPAIQQEMKRLIGRRDGLEPHKVRLTRGALARMYAQGELYAQAIAELRSALQEDPDRPDLQVLLADMYWRTEQRPEATSIANQILEKLPYCVDANRILAANLQGRERIEEAAVYHRRLASLDPYAAFIEKATEDAATVEEGAVAVEKLEWRPGEPLPTKGPAQPSWAATLGMEMQRDREAEEDSEPELPQTGPLPSWLEPGEPAPFEAGPNDELEQPSEKPAEPEEPDWLQAEATPESGEMGATEDEFLADLERRAEILPEMSEPEPESEGESASEIPDWMQEAGWTESTGEAVEQPVSFSDDELRSLEAGELPPEPSQGSAEDEELSPAELPDWIHTMAPEEGAEGEIEVEPASDGTGELPGWLAADRPSPESSLVEQAADEPEASLEPASQDLAQEASATEAAPDPAPAEPMATDRAEQDISLPSADDGKELPTWITDETPGATDTIVTWLGGQDRERRPMPSEEPEEPAEEALPSWMIDTGPLEETSEAGIGLPGPEAEPEPVAEQKPAEPPSGAPGWLSAVAEVAAQEDRPLEEIEPEPEPSDIGEEISGPEDLAPAEPPDWLADVISGPGDTMDADEIIAETARLQGETSEEVPADATPSTMQTEASDSGDWLRDESQEAAPQIGADTPDWLRGLAEEGPGPAEAAPAAEPPDWLRDIAEPGRDVPDRPASAPEPVEAAPEPAAAEEQPEPETTPDLSQFEAPDERAEVESAPEVPEPASEAMEPPDWLQGIGEESEAQAADSGAPDWLTGIAEEDLFETEIPEGVPEGLGLQPEPEPEPEGFLDLGEPEAPAPPPAEEDDEVIRWLEDLATAQEETEIPETIQQASPAQPATPMLEERQFPEDSEEGLEWLEELADQRGLDVDVRLPQARPPAEPAAAPTAEPALEFEAEAPGPPDTPKVSEEDSAPDWLSRMSTQPIPQIDLEALQAAAADAERAQPEQVEAEVDPAAETIKTRSEDLQAELARHQAEAPERAEEPEPMTEDEVPEWLVQAAAAEASETLTEPSEATQEPVAAEPEMVEPPVAPEAEPPTPVATAQPEPSIAAEVEPVQPAIPAEPVDQAPPPVTERPAETVEVPAPAAPVEETTPSVPAEPVAQAPVAAEPEAETVEAAAPSAPAEETAPSIPAEPAAQAPVVAEPEAETVEAAAPAAPAEETAPSVPAEPVEQAPVAAEPVAETVEAAPAAPAEETAPSVPAEPVEQVPVAAEPEAETVEAAAPAAPAPETEPVIAAEAPSETLGTVPAAEGELAPEPQVEPETVEPALSETVVPVGAPEVEPAALEAQSAEPEPELETVEMAEAADQPPSEPETVPQPAVGEGVESVVAEPVKQTKELAIEGARQALASGDTAAAVELYGKMIKRKDSLEAVIEDLRIALDRTPDDALLWQTLGDAYMKNDQSAEAIEAYRKGMEAA